MKLKDISLLLLRLAISYLWLTAGISKLLNKEFLTSFPATLETFAKNSPYPFYQKLLHEYAIPNSSLFAQLTTWGEISCGIAFLIGFPMLVATVVGIFMNLNYYLVANAIPSQFVNIILIFSQFAAYTNGAGNIWGFSTKVSKR